MLDVLPDGERALVRFVDYGSKSQISLTALSMLDSKFHSEPAQVRAALLAGRSWGC